MAAAHRVRAEREAVLQQLEHGRRQLEAERARSASAEQASTAVEGQRTQLVEQLGAQMHRQTEGAASMEELEEKAARAPAAVMAKLQALLGLNDSMTEQKGAFKGECARQLREWREELAKLRAMNEESTDAEGAKLAEIERICDAEARKEEEMRRLVGTKGRQSAALQREADDVPGSAELAQYERRFRELYAQLASKHDEAKKYYARYNTLEEQKVRRGAPTDTEPKEPLQ